MDHDGEVHREIDYIHTSMGLALCSGRGCLFVMITGSGLRVDHALDITVELL